VRFDAGMPDVMPPGYYVDEVYLEQPEPGEWLREQGFDISWPRRALHEKRLVFWLQAYVDDMHGAPAVGHAAVSWADTGRTVACLDVLESRRGTPGEVLVGLARHAVHSAAEAGAHRIASVLDVTALRDAGFRPAASGDRVERDLTGS
jgi:hypothetical protein